MQPRIKSELLVGEKNHPDSVQKKVYSHALVKNDKGEGMGAY